MVCLICETYPDRDCRCSKVEETKEKKKRKKTMKEIFTLKPKGAK